MKYFFDIFNRSINLCVDQTIFYRSIHLVKENAFRLLVFSEIRLQTFSCTCFKLCKETFNCAKSTKENVRFISRRMKTTQKDKSIQYDILKKENEHLLSILFPSRTRSGRFAFFSFFEKYENNPGQFFMQWSGLFDLITQSYFLRQSACRRIDTVFIAYLHDP